MLHPNHSGSRQPNAHIKKGILNPELKQTAAIGRSKKHFRSRPESPSEMSRSEEKISSRMSLPKTGRIKLGA